MTCQDIRDQLLGCERPDRPGPAASAHLRACGPCRAWVRRLARLERAIPRLPVAVPAVPPSLFEALEPVGPLVRLHRPAGPDRREGARRKLALASSLAAALLLFALGLWAWPHLRTETPSGLAEYRIKRDAALAGKGHPADKVRALVRLGDALVDLAVADPERAEVLAEWYEELVLADLPSHARSVPVAERPAAVKALLDGLGRTESRAARMAAAEADVRLARALTRIAASARHADRMMRSLAA